MQKIGPPPYAHVGRKPHHHPHQSDPSQNWKGDRASGHASSPLEVSNAAQPTTGGCSCMQRVMSRHFGAGERGEHLGRENIRGGGQGGRTAGGRVTVAGK